MKSSWWPASREPLLSVSQSVESLSCMTWNKNNSAPVLNVLKCMVFSPDGYPQNVDASPRIKNGLRKGLHPKFEDLITSESFAASATAWRQLGKISL